MQILWKRPKKWNLDKDLFRLSSVVTTDASEFLHIFPIYFHSGNFSKFSINA